MPISDSLSEFKGKKVVDWSGEARPGDFAAKVFRVRVEYDEAEEGVTISEAAAPRDTMIALIVAVIAGGIILFPALAVLFRLTLAGHLSPGEAAADAPGDDRPPAVGGTLLTRLAVAGLVVGLGFLTVADAAWAHAIGVAALFGFAIQTTFPVATGAS